MLHHGATDLMLCKEDIVPVNRYADNSTRYAITKRKIESRTGGEGGVYGASYWGRILY